MGDDQIPYRHSKQKCQIPSHSNYTGHINEEICNKTLLVWHNVDCKFKHIIKIRQLLFI